MQKPARVLYADPPWQYGAYGSRNLVNKPYGNWTFGAASYHYDTMSTQEICNLAHLDVVRNTTEDCALFLWTTCPFIPDALRVMDAWGYEYKTVAFVWIKINKSLLTAIKKSEFQSWTAQQFFEAVFVRGTRMSLGNYVRGNAEICFLGKKKHGNTPKVLNRGIRQIIFAPVGEHSEKPSAARSRIENLLAGPYREMFARQRPQDWQVWGKGVEK